MVCNNKKVGNSLRLCENGFEFQGISPCVTHMPKSMHVPYRLNIRHIYISVYTHSAIFNC